MNDIEVKLDPNAKVLEVKINLNPAQGNAKVTCYGGLKLAEEEASKYFMIMELKRRQQQEALGLLKPNGKPN